MEETMDLLWYQTDSKHRNPSLSPYISIPAFHSNNFENKGQDRICSDVAGTCRNRVKFQALWKMEHRRGFNGWLLRC